MLKRIIVFSILLVFFIPGFALGKAKLKYPYTGSLVYMGDSIQYYQTNLQSCINKYEDYVTDKALVLKERRNNIDSYNDSLRLETEKARYFLDEAKFKHPDKDWSAYEKVVIKIEKRVKRL